MGTWMLIWMRLFTSDQPEPKNFQASTSTKSSPMVDLSGSWQSLINCFLLWKSWDSVKSEYYFREWSKKYKRLPGVCPLLPNDLYNENVQFKVFYMANHQIWLFNGPLFSRRNIQSDWLIGTKKDYTQGENWQKIVFV